MNIYSNIDIDIAFKFFNSENAVFTNESIFYLLKKSLNHDKIGYVSHLYSYIFNNKIDISGIDFDDLFKDYSNFYTNDNFSYDKSILLMKFFYYYSSCLIKLQNVDMLLSKEIYFAKFYEKYFKKNEIDFKKLFTKIIEIRENNLDFNDNNTSSYGNIFDILDNYYTSFVNLDKYSKIKGYSLVFLNEKTVADLICLQLENEK